MKALALAIALASPPPADIIIQRHFRDDGHGGYYMAGLTLNYVQAAGLFQTQQPVALWFPDEQSALEALFGFQQEVYPHLLRVETAEPAFDALCFEDFEG